jgi:hypothetical protein
MNNNGQSRNLTIFCPYLNTYTVVLLYIYIYIYFIVEAKLKKFIQDSGKPSEGKEHSFYCCFLFVVIMDD